MSDSDPPKTPILPAGSFIRSSSTSRYFFDVDDGEASTRDEAGIDLFSADDIPREAYNLLRELVQDRLPEGHRTMTVRVRDESGNLVYAGEMTINGRRRRS